MKDYQLKINGQQYDVQIDNVNEASTEARVVVNGVEYDVEIAGAQPTKMPAKPQVSPVPSNATPNNPTPAGAKGTPRAVAPSASGAKVASPLPGTIMDVKVAVGDIVKAGQTLVVIEAMKMENNIDAPCAGTVKEVAAQKGASVMEGDTLIIIG